MKKNSLKGFTVLELLIVIAIMCVLIALILVGLTAARQHSKDENNISAVQNVTVALAQYFDTCRSYPATLTGNETCPALLPQKLANIMPAIASYQFNGQGSLFVYRAFTSSSASNPDLSICSAFHIGVTLGGKDSYADQKSGFYIGQQPYANELTACAGSQKDFDGTPDIYFDIYK